MELGSFYFIDNGYYEKFNDCGLLNNREATDITLGGRPCYYAFKENESGVYWMIPFSSKIEKYQQEQQVTIKKFGFCDGIVFGYILGEKKAFLIQNMCPVTDKYITNIYIDKNSNKPISIPNKLKSELNAKIRKAVRLYRKGTVVLSKALYIEAVLLEELNDDRKQVFEGVSDVEELN